MSISDEIHEQVEVIDGQYKAIFAKIVSVEDGNKQSIPQVDKIPNYHESINGLRARISAAIGMFKVFRIDDKGFVLVPRPYLNGFKSGLKGVIEAFNSITGAMSNFESNGGIGSINSSNFEVVSSNQVFSFNFASALQAIDSQLDRALDNYYRITSITKEKDYSSLSVASFDYSEALDSFSVQRRSISKVADEIVALKKKVDEQAQAISQILEKADSTNKNIIAIKDESDSKLKDIVSVQNSAQQKLPSIEEIYNKATALKKEVDAYLPQFEQFRSQLEQRTVKHNEGSKKLDDLIKTLEEQKMEVERINADASAALNFATVAGLAKGFQDQRNALGVELESAYIAFRKALWALFASSLASATYIALVIFKFLGDTQEINFQALFILLLLAVPAIIMTKFTASRYHSLFILREQYAHKFSVAFSVENFIKGLDGGEHDKILATTFLELSQNNPANLLNGKSDSVDHPLPIWNKIIDMLFPTKGS